MGSREAGDSGVMGDPWGGDTQGPRGGRGEAKKVTRPRGRQGRARRERLGAPEGVGPGDGAPQEIPGLGRASGH